jgi:hypothetical protein
MLSPEIGGGGVHPIEFGYRAEERARVALQGTGLGVDAIAVRPATGVIARVKVVRRAFHGAHGDGVGREAVERTSQPVGIRRRVQVNVGDLSARMHPRIRAPRAGDPMGGREHGTQCIFKGALDGPHLGLDLPPVEVGSVVFNEQPVARHEGSGTF